MGLGIRGAGAGDDNSKVAVDCLLISSRWVASFLFYVTLSDITFNLTRIRQKGTTSIIRGCHYQYQRKKEILGLFQPYWQTESGRSILDVYITSNCPNTYIKRCKWTDF